MNRFLTRPLYLQLRDALVERIARGQWKPGAAVPNEQDLAREFGVSPGTMRKALDLMESMRLITRRPGRGTFINDPSSEELANRYNTVRRANGASIPDDVACGEITEAPANDAECERLRLTKDDHVYRLNRRRLTGGRAYMVEDVSLPATVFPGLADAQIPYPLITTLASQYGILLGKADERVSADGASLEIAEALGIAFQTPVMVLDRVVFGIDGRPIEWRVGWYHLPGGHYFAEMT